MKKIKIGILGYANIAKKAIIPALLQSNQFELHAIATSNQKNIEQIKETLGVEVFSQYQDLVDHPAIQAVYIPLPNALHFEWVKKSLAQHKHVLVEKSLACTEQEVLELCALAQKNNLALVENFQFRFHKQLDFILQLINNGTIGDVRSLRSSFCFPPFEDKNNIRYQKNLGGGALLDAGAYPIKLAQILLGNNLQVSHAQMAYDNQEVDIWGNGTISQKNGNLSLQFSYGFDHHYQCNIEIIGSLGKIIANRIYTAPPGYNPEIMIEKGNKTEKHLIENQNHFANMLNHFYQCIHQTELKNIEIEQNILQSQLISQFNKKSHE